MFGAKHAQWAIVAVACIAVAAAILAGVRLRLTDPLSSPVMAAEDPYTHMALVREHTRDGTLESLNPDGRLYPPGMHAFIAAAWAFTGANLYELMRLLPILFGVLCMVGVAVLLWRSDGPVAAFVGALTAAVAPEAILRTTLMTPTAVDLALLPFFIYAILEVLQGRYAWAAVAAPLGLFLVFAHPWVMSIVGLAAIAFLAITLMLPWPAARGKPATAIGLAIATAIVGLNWGLALSGCGGLCGPGFRDVYPGGDQLNVFGPFIAVGSLIVAALFAWGARPIDRLLKRPVTDPTPSKWRGLVCILLGIIFVVVTYTPWRTGWPNLVDPVYMFGWPLIILGVVGFVMMPFLASPAANMGAAIAASTYLFVIYDPFKSPFWSHRTAIYLALGLFLLAGAVAGAMARAGLEAMQARREEAQPATPRRRARPFAIVLPVVLVVAFLGGTVYAATPQKDDPHWYRLFTPCEFETLERLAQRVTNEPRAIVITGDWQAKLVLAALATDASRIWYKGDFFTSTADHAGLMQLAPLYVVVDRYLTNETPGADASLFEQAPWQEAARSCPEGETQLVVFSTRGGPL